MLERWTFLGVCVALTACSVPGGSPNLAQPVTPGSQAMQADRSVSQVSDPGPYAPYSDSWGRRGYSARRLCLRLYLSCRSVAQQSTPDLPGLSGGGPRRGGCAARYQECLQRLGL